MTLNGNWNYPTSVRFGPGRIRELADACKTAGLQRPLLVTDPGVSPLPMIAAAVALCRSAGLGIDVFDKVQSNPIAGNVADGLEAYRAGGHDGVVAFGGGSALDVGKVIAFMGGQTRPMWDFEDVGDWWTRADPNGIAPIVAVPTTSGTGSEVGRAGVITDETTHTKKIIFHPKMMPKIAILDPELTIGLPPRLTAGVGMDALSHPVGSLHGAHHGMTNAVFMPYVLVFNRAAIEPRIERLAAYLGLHASFEAFLEWVLALRREIGVPHTLVALGVPLDQADLVAEMALVDPTAGSNPIALSKSSLRGIFDRAANGDLA